MGDCMRCLGESGLKDAVLRALANKPVLAVCIGMQMLFERSDENDCAGLGLMAGKVIRFPQAALVRANGERLKVPQMGWNTVTQRMAHPLWDGIADKSWFYFVHSYFVAPEDDSLAAGTSSYGLPFVCAVARDNIFATQFHPEKSAASGLKLFQISCTGTFELSFALRPGAGVILGFKGKPFFKTIGFHHAFHSCNRSAKRALRTSATGRFGKQHYGL